MAEPKDIRRQVGEISPSIFVDPGVPDTSTARMVGTLGQLGMEVDAQLAKNNFAESVESLRSQYLTQPSAQEATMSPVADDDGGDGFVPTAMDNKAIADFGQTLDAHAQAAAQGRRSQDAFRIAAERLYRVAISKRPGLAREFRQVAEGFLGFDVVGASVDIAARQDQEWMKGLADAAKTKSDHAYDFYKREQDEWAKLGYSQAMQVPFEQWAAYTEAHRDSFNQLAQAKVSSQLADQEMKVLEFQGKKSSEADTRYFTSKASEIISGYDASIHEAIARASVPDEAGRRLIDSPDGMAQVVTGLRDGLHHNMDLLRQSVAGRDVPVDTLNHYMSRMQESITRADNLLSGKDRADFAENFNNYTKAETVRALLDNTEARLIAGMQAAGYGEVVMADILKNNAKTFSLAMAQVVTNSIPANQIAKIGPRTVSSLIASVWKHGSKTPPDPMATSRASQDIATILSKYYLQDDANFRPQDFTSWNGTQGILPVLTSRAKIIGPSLSEEERGEIVAQGAAASGNSALRLMALLAKKSPGLVEKLDLASVWRPDTPGLARPKPGAKLSPAETQVLAHFGKQFNREQISQFMAAYGAGDPAKSWSFIAKSVEPMLGIKQQMSLQAQQQAASQAAQEAVQGASGGGAGRGVARAKENPPVGTLRNGYRYVGKGPGQPFDGNQEGSWQPAGESSP